MLIVALKLRDERRFFSSLLFVAAIRTKTLSGFAVAEEYRIFLDKFQRNLKAEYVGVSDDVNPIGSACITDKYV